MLLLQAGSVEVVAQVQQRGTAQSNQQWLSHSMQDSSSEQHTAPTSAAQQVDPTHEAFWPPGSAPGTLSYALTQVELLAAPGSSWPPEQQAAFTKAADLVGGFWVLTQCGEWGEGHPLVGQPARVLTQLVFSLLAELSPEAVQEAKQSRQRVPPWITVLKGPLALVPPGEAQVVTQLVYDAQGWPTGKAGRLCVVHSHAAAVRPGLHCNHIQHRSRRHGDLYARDWRAPSAVFEAY